MHTHIHLLHATGTGEKVLEHYLGQNNNANLNRVFYFQGDVLDFSQMPIRYYMYNEKKGWHEINRNRTAKRK